MNLSEPRLLRYRMRAYRFRRDGHAYCLAGFPSQDQGIREKARAEVLRKGRLYAHAVQVLSR